MEKNALQSEQNRQAILDAAVQAFQQNGVQATKMDDIASLAGVSKRTLYKHFNSKEVLFENITDKIWQQWMQASAHPYDATAPLHEQLIDIARHEMALFESDEYIRLYRMILAEYLHTPEAAQQCLQKTAEFGTGLRHWLKQAMADKRMLEVDPRLAATQFLGMLKTFAFWPQVAGHAPKLSEQETEQVIQHTVAMFLSYYAIN